jgi:hypothetical protein
VAKVIRSEISLPKDPYVSISIHLLFAIEIKKGVELSGSSFRSPAWPAAVVSQGGKKGEPATATYNPSWNCYK